MRQFPSQLPVLVVQQYQGNSSDRDTVELLRRGDLFQTTTTAVAAGAGGADVHMNLLKHTSVFLPSIIHNNTSLHSRLFAAGGTSDAKASATATATASVEDISLEEGSNDLSSPSLPEPEPVPRPPFSGRYLVVLVHGFQGE